jgi:hypothetical protein
MLTISTDMMVMLTREHFLRRLGQFVKERCRRPALVEWVRAQPPGAGAWRAAWPLVSGLSEHDCALVLVFLAACECEGLAPPPVEQLVAALPRREVGFKQFLSGRGYFGFSAFELCAGAVAA